MSLISDYLPADLAERLTARGEAGVIDPPVRAPSGGMGIRLDGLGKSFGANRILHDIDLAVRPGEFLAIVGRSGCGKTTLLRLLAGLDTPDEGRIELDGRPSEGQPPATRLLFQTPRLLPWQRVLDNVAIGRRTPEGRDAARAALRQVGLEAKADVWPSTLSGGQAQRVALARALTSHPRLLLLDEPLGALDALTRLEMQELIERVWLTQRFTAVLVTHDVAEAARLADRIVVLEAGRIAASWVVGERRPRPRAGAVQGAIEAQILAHLLR
ncbi:MAG TPA: ABC transporter ATP-binding protein [Aliidongia sp.]|nr:ABC transporter ATP-binding protein [Aliidongia sp.]